MILQQSLFEMSFAVFFVGQRLRNIESRKAKYFSNGKFNLSFNKIILYKK